MTPVAPRLNADNVTKPTVGLLDHLVGAQLTIPVQLWLGGDCLDWETQDASAALIDRDVAGGDLVFVGGEGCQYFGLLALRDLDEVQGPSEFSSDWPPMG